MVGIVSAGNFFSADNALLTTLPILLLTIISGLAGYGLFSMFYIGNILILNNNTPQVSYKNILRQSLSLIFPVVSGLLLAGFIILGGLFLFIIPGIIFALFFQFVVYLIILDKLSIKDALKRSTYLVSKAFGPIFVRVILLSFIPFAFSLTLNLITGYSLDETTLGIINGLLSLFYSFFAISYNLILFRQVKTFSGEGSGNIRFLAMIAIIGWILMLFITFFGFNYISSFINQNTPSLTTTDTSGLPEEEFLYEEDISPSTPSATPSISSSPIPTRSAIPTQVSTTSATPL